MRDIIIIYFHLPVENPFKKVYYILDKKGDINMKTYQEQMFKAVRECLQWREQKARYAWDRGVIMYAFDLVDNIEDNAKYCDRMPSNKEDLKRICLNGADNFREFSYAGKSLCYNGDIAKRLCNPSKLKKTNYGMRRPNAREDWLDTQARALCQAYILVKEIWIF